MPIAAILDQIDAYLSSLRQARELLSAPMKEVPEPLETSPQKRNTKLKKTSAAASTTPRAPKRKSRLSAPAAERSPVKGRARIHPPSQVSSSLPLPVAPPDPQPHVEDATPAPAPPANPAPIISTEQPPAPQPPASRRAVRRSSPKPPARPSSELAKPAIALAGSMHSKIVVVSAEEARKERNRTAPPPAVRRPRVPSTGGRLAFEALFKDSSDPSTSSGQ